MKYLYILLITTFLISCGSPQSNVHEIIKNNPFLIGTWTGTGNFLNISFNQEMGDIDFKVNITQNSEVRVFIGDTEIDHPEITKADYGFALKGTLKGPLKNGTPLTKDKIIILLVFPAITGETTRVSEANFHLKSNFVFDFTMKVGGVTLTKTSD